MALISGTVAYQTTVVITGASGDGAAVAAKFSGIVIPGVSPTAATATDASGVVTITWPAATIRVADMQALTAVTNIMAADTALTAPITIVAKTQAVLAA